MVGLDRFQWLRDIPWGPALWLVGQTIAIVIVIVRLGDRVTILERDHVELTASVAKLDVSGSRGLDLIRQQIATNSERITALLNRETEIFKMINDILIKMAASDPKVQGQMAVLEGSIKRLDEQQIRIIQALDNTYNLLQEHMRGQNPKPQNNKK